MDVDCMLENCLMECRIGCRLHACILFEKKSTVIVDFMIANYFHKIPQWLLLIWLQANGKRKKKRITFCVLVFNGTVSSLQY